MVTKSYLGKIKLQYLANGLFNQALIDTLCTEKTVASVKPTSIPRNRLQNATKVVKTVEKLKTPPQNPLIISD